MTAETQTQFAERMGVHKSTVTRWKQDGRLVLDPSGRVDVEASLHAIQATEGVAPMHVARRESLAESREAARAPAAAADQEPMVMDTLARIGAKTKFEAMRKLKAEADRAEMDRDRLRGELIERREVQKDLADAVAVILNAAETLPDRLAPVLTGVAEQTTVRAILRDEVEQFLATVAERLGQVVGNE